MQESMHPFICTFYSLEAIIVFLGKDCFKNTVQEVHVHFSHILQQLHFIQQIFHWNWAGGQFFES